MIIHMRDKVIESTKIYGPYPAVYAASMLFASRGHYYFSGACLILAALWLYINLAGKHRNPVDLRAIFSLAFVGGEGISALKLSRLQSDWNPKTWLVFFCAYVFFILAFEAMPGDKQEEKPAFLSKERETCSGGVLFCIAGLFWGSILSFLAEAAILGYVPLFSDKPHAYSEFHVTGLHYFTISCVLIPALTVIYFYLKPKMNALKWGILALGNFAAVAIPFLCVSRFQLLFAVGFAVCTYVLVSGRITVKMVAGLLAVMIPLYVIVTVFRHHDVAYLNGIFEMKNPNIPIFITQPYMYIANNYDNVNCLVNQLPAHTYGIRMAFPIVALSGLKFSHPELVAPILYITKEELTTVTLFYDAYYDFGVVGVAAFAAVLGAFCKRLYGKVYTSGNPITVMFYGQIAIYLGLSFFTTWFSNPTTWFWLTGTLAMYVLLHFWGRRKFDKESAFN